MGLVLLRDRSRDLTFRRHFILGSSHPLSDWLENQAQQQRMQEYFVVVIRLVLIGSPFGELVCVAPLARKFHSYRQIFGQVRRRKKNIHTFVHEAYFVVRRTVYLCASRS